MFSKNYFLHVVLFALSGLLGMLAVLSFASLDFIEGANMTNICVALFVLLIVAYGSTKVIKSNAVFYISIILASVPVFFLLCVLCGIIFALLKHPISLEMLVTISGVGTGLALTRFTYGCDMRLLTWGIKNDDSN